MSVGAGKSVEAAEGKERQWRAKANGEKKEKANRQIAKKEDEGHS